MNQSLQNQNPNQPPSEKEAMLLFLPESISIVNELMLIATKEIKSIEQKKKEVLRNRQRYAKEKAEFLLEFQIEDLDKKLKEQQRKMYRCTRYLYYTVPDKDKNQKHFENFAELVKIAEQRPILDVISTKITVKKSSHNRYVATCPFHQDNKPSLTIYLDSNSFYCFSCGQGGTPIDFIMKLYNVNFNQAIKELNL